MKRVLTAVLVLAMILAIGFGCGQKEAETPDKAPEGVREAEAMDTTRMDSAMMDTSMMDTLHEMSDTM